MNKCVDAVPAVDLDGDDRWMSIHKRFLCETREKDAEVIFIGDSIIQALQHTETWNELFAPLHCLNLGIHRDRIENVLWRIENGELDYAKPRVIIVHVGTNNHDCDVNDIYEGILKIVDMIRQKHSEVYIIVPTLLPRGHHPNSIRSKLQAVNQLLIKHLDHKDNVQVVEIDKGFVQFDGTISHFDMHDYLILTNSGCRKAFEPVYDLLLQLLSEGESEKYGMVDQEV